MISRLPSKKVKREFYEGFVIEGTASSKPKLMINNTLVDVTSYNEGTKKFKYSTLEEVTRLNNLFSNVAKDEYFSITKLEPTTEVYEMQNMFNGCRNISQEVFDNLDVSRLKEGKGMFQNLEYDKDILDLTKLDFYSIENASSMFSGVKGVKEIKFKPSEEIKYGYFSVRRFSNMFSNCSAVRLDLSMFKNYKTLPMDGLCGENLEYLDISQFIPLSKVVYKNWILCYCTNLKTIRTNRKFRDWLLENEQQVLPQQFRQGGDGVFILVD